MPHPRLLPLLLLLLPLHATASAPPPVVQASLSPNGHWLVVTEQELGPPEPPMGGQRILKTGYHILYREPFLNDKDRLSAPVPFWTSSWQIDEDPAPGQFWPMITDDGQTVVLIHVTFRDARSVALKIYHRNQNGQGDLNRTLDVAGLLSDSELHPEGSAFIMFRDSSPSWFAGGTFTFSADSQDLLFHTEAHAHLRIHLPDGAVTREHP